MNQLQAAAMNEGVRRKKALWSKSGRAQLESLPLAPWAARRRHDLLELLDRLNPTIEELSAVVEEDFLGSFVREHLKGGDERPARKSTAGLG